MDHLDIARRLDIQRNRIAEQATDETMHNSYWIERFGPAVREQILIDTDHTLATLIKAVRYRSPMMIDDYALWLRKTLVGLRCSTGSVRDSLSRIWSAAVQYMPSESHTVIYDYIQSALNTLAYSNPSARSLEAAHNELAEALIAEVYDQHWHWQAAYGPGGRERALYDAWYCLDFLIDALGIGAPDVFTRHMLWLRDYLVKQGLSTAHCQQLTWLIADLIARRQPAAAHDVEPILQHAAAALAHLSESCQSLTHAQDQIVFEAAEELNRAGLGLESDQTAIEIGWYLAFLNDALALNDPSGLISYTRWMQHWFASQGLPDTPLRQSYAALADALRRHLPEPAAQQALSLLHSAQSAF